MNNSIEFVCYCQKYCSKVEALKDLDSAISDYVSISEAGNCSFKRCFRKIKSCFQKWKTWYLNTMLLVVLLSKYGYRKSNTLENFITKLNEYGKKKTIVEIL